MFSSTAQATVLFPELHAHQLPSTPLLSEVAITPLPLYTRVMRKSILSIYGRISTKVKPALL